MVQFDKHVVQLGIQNPAPSWYWQGILFDFIKQRAAKISTLFDIDFWCDCSEKSSHSTVLLDLGNITQEFSIKDSYGFVIFLSRFSIFCMALLLFCLSIRVTMYLLWSRFQEGIATSHLCSRAMVGSSPRTMVGQTEMRSGVKDSSWP